MTYKIIVGRSASDLSANVNLHMLDGWKPIGNIFTEIKEEIFWNEWQTVVYFGQPMIRDS